MSQADIVLSALNKAQKTYFTCIHFYVDCGKVKSPEGEYGSGFQAPGEGVSEDMLVNWCQT